MARRTKSTPRPLPPCALCIRNFLHSHRNLTFYEIINYDTEQFNDQKRSRPLTDAKIKKESFTDAPEKWVEAYGDKLYRFALTRVRDTGIAEDLVQETFLAALEGKRNFKGHSSVLTWMIGILKHKLIDYLRKSQKEFAVENIESYTVATDDLFDEKGRWKTGPAKWVSDPMGRLEQHEFFKIFHNCLDHLGKRLSLIFTLREVDDLETEEICKILSITTTNLWVLMYRARTKLRTCLEKNGFGVKS
jgi:RNA polymerase sigma-70 factor (TIGR02943 family)